MKLKATHVVIGLAAGALALVLFKKATKPRIPPKYSVGQGLIRGDGRTIRIDRVVSTPVGYSYDVTYTQGYGSVTLAEADIASVYK